VNFVNFLFNELFNEEMYNEEMHPEWGDPDECSASRWGKGTGCRGGTEWMLRLKMRLQNALVDLP
jgi:hypothetical protein